MTFVSSWVWTSMKPGERTRPSPSVTFRAHVLGELPDRANDAGVDSYIRSLGFGATAVEHANVPDKRVTKRHMAW